MVVSETLGGAFLSASLAVLFERLFSRDFLSLIRENKESLKRLKIVLLSVHALMDDAEEKQHGDLIIREWLLELKEAIYDAEDLLHQIEDDALQSQINKSQVLGEISASLNAFFENRNSKIEAMIDRLELFVKQKDILGLRENVGNWPLKGICPAPLVEESDVYGRDRDKEFIINLLQSVNDNKIDVISIVGMGGIGKTTLAQLVYNDDRVKSQFDFQAWVYVSDKFDIFGLTKKVSEAVKMQTHNIHDLFELQSQLRKALEGKRFLLVLDDIWNENYNYWDSFKSSLRFGRSGSKIIITTRSEKVCSITSSSFCTYRLDTVSLENSWLIFKKHAFGGIDSSSFQHLLDMGSQIVRRCRGLPLALKSLGGLLHCELDIKEWEKIANSEIWGLSEKDNNILPALLLSYFRLPQHIRLCFSYCSIFEKGSELEKEKLVSLWMAEGLLPCQKGKMIETVGEEYLGTLLSSSLFQKSSRGDQYVEMHDLVHDLATYVSGEFCLRLYNGWHGIASKTRYLSFADRFNSTRVCFQKFRQLVSSDDNCFRTIISLTKPLKDGSRNELAFLKTLAVRSIRALSLEDYQIFKLDTSIENLLHIRYLNLSGNSFREIQPNTISGLCNLETLLLTKCTLLISLPSDMQKLIKLRYLDISGTSLKEMPPDMCNMKDLQRLTDFILSKDTGSRIKDLRDLQYLHGGLMIWGLHNIDDTRNAIVANLKDKEYLSRLKLTWDCRDDESQAEREVLERLQPHKNLKELTIQGYNGSMFPRWIGDDSFTNIVSLHLNSCRHCSSLPPLGQLPSLEIIHITGFDKLRTIANEFYYGDLPVIDPFRSLKELHFGSMLKWQNWSFTNRDGRNIVLPCIEKIDLENCPKLSDNGLPTWVRDKLSRR